MGAPSNDPNPSNNQRSILLQAFYLADIRLQGGPNKATQPFMNTILPDTSGPKTFEDIGPEVNTFLPEIPVKFYSP